MGSSESPDQGSGARQVRDVIARLVRDGTAVARSDGTLHDLFPVAASAAESQALRDWILREEAARTVEIGLGYGISALHICEGLLKNSSRAPRHVVIDPYQATRFSDCGLQFLDEAGAREIVELHAEDSGILLPRFLDEARNFDFAFVDGNHRFDGVFIDLFYLGRLVQPGGIVFSMTISCPASPARPRSSRRTWAGPWRKSRPRTTCTSGRYCVPPRFPTRDPSTTSSIFEAMRTRPAGTALYSVTGAALGSWRSILPSISMPPWSRMRSSSMISRPSGTPSSRSFLAVMLEQTTASTSSKVAMTLS